MNAEPWSRLLKITDVCLRDELRGKVSGAVVVVVQFVWLNCGLLVGLVGDRGGVGVVPPLGMF